MPGTSESFNQSLERAIRVADFMELGELMVLDALEREESCGCHLREEYQTNENEALRNDDEYCYVSVWEHQEDDDPALHTEPLNFENVQLSQRSYK